MGLFEFVGHLQDLFFRQVRSDDLHADRQPVGETARQRQRRRAGEVDGNRAYVHQVHGQRIGNFFADLERRSRRGGSDEDVHLLERPVKVLFDQGPDLQRLQVIGVIITGTQGIGAEHDAPLDLRPEAFGPGTLVHRNDVGAFTAMAEPDAVITTQVGAGFRRGDEVIGGQSILRVRHGYFDQFSAHGDQFVNGATDRRFDGRFHAGHEIFAGQADLQAFDARAQVFRIVGNRRVDRGRIAAVMAADRPEHQCAVPDIFRKRSDLVERGRIGNQAVARNPSVGRFQADYSAISRRHADRPAGVGTERPNRFARRHRRAGAAAGAAGNPVGVPGIAGHKKAGVFG